jgi:hypothetical protein
MNDERVPSAQSQSASNWTQKQHIRQAVDWTDKDNQHWQFVESRVEQQLNESWKLQIA